MAKKSKKKLTYDEKYTWKKVKGKTIIRSRKFNGNNYEYRGASNLTNAKYTTNWYRSQGFSTRIVKLSKHRRQEMKKDLKLKGVTGNYNLPTHEFFDGKSLKNFGKELQDR